MSPITETIAQEIDALRKARDELRLQLHLGKAEARDRFAALETKWHEVEQRSEQLRRASGESMRHIAEGTRELVRELRDGYRDIKSAL